MGRPLAGESEAGCDAAPVSAWTDGVLLERAAAGEAGEAGNDLRLDQPNPRLVGLRPAAGGVASGVSACEGVAEYEEGKPKIPMYHVKGTGVQLYAIRRGGELKHYPNVVITGDEEFKDLPSQGALSNPDDAPLVKDIENKMIDAFGHAIVEIKCKPEASANGEVFLGCKLLRPQHVGSLMAAVEKHQVAKLNLVDNQLGPEGGAKLAEALKTNTTLTKLDLCNNQLGPEGGAKLAEARKTLTSLTSLQCALAALEPMPSARSCGRAPG